MFMTMIQKFSDVHEVLRQYVPPARSMREKYTLERISKFMKELGNPQENYKVIHVAGTSGKTSTCYYLAALLGQTGKKIGMTISPHIDEVNERLQINLTPLPEKQFCQELKEFLEILNKLSVKPTYFELLIAFAFWEFARQKVDYAVVEVGLGGLLDGTNVINRSDKVCVITDIGLDHTNVLGGSLSEIAAQKAGIIKQGNIVFSYKQAAEITNILREVSRQNKAKLYEIEQTAPLELIKNLPLFQQRNWYLAAQTVDYVLKRDHLSHLTEEKLIVATKTYVPARMEIVKVGSKTVILDGAHNPQKAQVLVKSLQAKYPEQKMSVIMGLLSDKDLSGFLKEITPIARRITSTAFRAEQDMPRGSIGPEEIVRAGKTQGFDNIEAILKPELAFETILEQTEDTILVIGSFFLLNHIRPLVKRGKVEV